MNRSELARLILSDPARAKREAARIVERPRLEKPKAPRKAGILPARKNSPAKLSRSELRALAMKRDGGRCVIGGEPHLYRNNEPHMHHVIRRDELGCVAMLCWMHHDPKSCYSVHAGYLPALLALAAYCTEQGMKDAALALSKRIEKVRESRRSGGET